MSVCAGSRGTAGAPRAKPGPARSMEVGCEGGEGGGITFISLSYIEREHNMPTHIVHLSDAQTANIISFYSMAVKQSVFVIE